MNDLVGACLTTLSNIRLSISQYKCVSQIEWFRLVPYDSMMVSFKVS